MKKATMLFLVMVVMLFFGVGISFACGGHEGGDMGKGGGHEMMTPEGGHMGCPMHKADGGDKTAPEAAPAPAPAPDSGMNHENMPEGHACPHHDGGDSEHGADHGGEGHQCPHHK